jgi:hypothetical protein
MARDPERGDLIANSSGSPERCLFLLVIAVERRPRHGGASSPLDLYVTFLNPFTGHINTAYWADQPVYQIIRRRVK